MSDVAFLAGERFFRTPIRDFFKRMCCHPLQFMWDNHLLTPRDDIHTVEGAEGTTIWVRQMTGFAVRRTFGALHKGERLYACPFCGRELIFCLGMDAGEQWIFTAPIEVGQGAAPIFRFTKKQLNAWLAETKRRERGGWPPRD